MRLAHDLIIPAGTEFKCIDGVKREYAEGNYEALVAAVTDHTISIVMEPEVLEALSTPVSLYGWRLMPSGRPSRPLTELDFDGTALILNPEGENAR